MNTIYICPRGHETSARLQIVVEDNGLLLEVMPYAGNYCFVCFAAFIAQHIPRTSEVVQEEA